MIKDSDSTILKDPQRWTMILMLIAVSIAHLYRLAFFRSHIVGDHSRHRCRAQLS